MCPNCHAELAPEAEFCPHCGATVRPQTGLSFPVGTWVFVIAGGLCILGGFLQTNELTMGVGIMIAGVFFAICARLIQAGHRR